MSDRTVPPRTVSPHTGVVDEPWRTASADAVWPRLDELVRLSRIRRNPADAKPPRASILRHAEDLPLTATTTPVQEGAVVRRKKLIFAAGLARGDHAGRRTVLLDPAADIPADTAEVVRLGRSDADSTPTRSRGEVAAVCDSPGDMTRPFSNDDANERRTK